YTFADQYRWLGFTARKRVLDMLDAIIADTTMKVDVFAYDLNEPDIIQRLLKLGKRGSVRVILDNAPLHHSTKKKTPEDEFERTFNDAAKSPAAVLRGHFQRFSHNKIFVVYKGNKAQTVLTGSTNFSVTGLYVNSNHLLVFNNPVVAAKYADLFNEAWD